MTHTYTNRYDFQRQIEQVYREGFLSGVRLFSSFHHEGCEEISVWTEHSLGTRGSHCGRCSVDSESTDWSTCTPPGSAATPQDHQAAPRHHRFRN